MPTPKIIDDEFKEFLKKVRNNMLSETDKYLLIPDLPEDILNDIKSYREQLRNITTKFGTEWQTEDDINWPEFPKKLMLAVLPIPSDN
jgi:hypothetical protein